MFSSNMRKLTDRLTKKFGDTVTLVEITQGAYNPQTGNTSDTEIEHLVKGVISEYTVNEQALNLIGVDDLKVMIYADSLDITKKWAVKYRGSNWRVLNVDKLSTQDSLVYIELQIRSK